MEDYKTKWNYIVDARNKLFDNKEEIIQFEWENYCSELFGYIKYLGEFESQKSEQFGTQNKIIPDIVLYKKKARMCVIELKRYSLNFDNSMEKQLSSYMNHFRVDLGVLVVNKIYLYYFDKEKRELVKAAISFNKDNSDGIKFIELISKDNIDENKIKLFIDEINNRVPTGDRITKGETFGYRAQSIYDNMCKRFGWDMSFSREFEAYNHKPLYANKATPEGYAVWFLAHNNWTGSRGGKWINKILDEKIEEFWIPRIFYDPKNIHSRDEVRVVFAKQYDGEYIFLGVYKVDMDSCDETYLDGYKKIRKVYTVQSDTYPLN